MTIMTIGGTPVRVGQTWRTVGNDQVVIREIISAVPSRAVFGSDGVWRNSLGQSNPPAVGRHDLIGLVWEPELTKVGRHRYDPDVKAKAAPELLEAAAAHMRDRAAAYNKPAGERSMAATVRIFNVFHGTGITEAQGWHFMQILKDVRLFTNIGTPHQDSIEDGVAYAALKGESLLNPGDTQ